MSRARITMICMLATGVAVSLSCSAQNPKEIAQKLYDQLDQSWANHDLNRVVGFLDSSYLLTDEHGKRKAFGQWLKEWQQEFPKFRSMNGATTVEDVQLDGGRMVVKYKNEVHYEWDDRPHGWVPLIYKSTGEGTWERKGGQWKLVRDTVFGAGTQVDPSWLEELQELERKLQKVWDDTVIARVRSADGVGHCNYPDC